LGATVEVRLQRHGARRVEEQCQNDTVQILFFFLLLLLLLYIFFLFVGTQKWVTTRESDKNDLKSSFSLPLHAQGRRRTMSFKMTLFRCFFFF
jgi:hypothetical protein